MKKKFNQVMVNNSTNINKTNNRLNLLNIKKTMTFDGEIQVLTWDRQKDVYRFTSIYYRKHESKTPPKIFLI